MEELSLRRIYGIGRIRLGNFVVQSPVNPYDFEDDFASSGARGVVDYVMAALKVIEAQMPGMPMATRRPTVFQMVTTSNNASSKSSHRLLRRTTTLMRPKSMNS